MCDRLSPPRESSSQRILLALPEAEREALLLRYVEDLSVREIAGIIGRTEKGVESLLRRAKQRAFAMNMEGTR